MEKPLWKFIDTLGTFVSETADRINTLYFPLCNTSPMMSSITPDLHGDIKTNNNSFLLQPVSRIDLCNLKSSRNFWLYLNPQKIWSATGVSKTTGADQFKLEAGLLWQKITRQNKKIGLKAEITSFVPASAEPVEIMLVEITNISPRPLKFTPTAAIPIYARSANNLRDHRHVTSLLNRTELDKFGVVVTPTLLFDESGHKENKTAYFVLGIDEESRAPEYIYPTQEDFCGENSDLEAPQAILNNLKPKKNSNIQGKEAMGGLKFKAKTLRAKESCSYIVLMGIVPNKNKISAILNKFNTPLKIKKSLAFTKNYWQKKSAEISISTPDRDFDNWFRWVSIQPALRKIFGCSFLPDFDYGKGGRGWRDLWQDALSLILTNPKEARNLLKNNFKGVRIDGSHATIIGQKPGEFIADRNNLSRVWMDHGTWPLITTYLYIHQTGDLSILLEEATYFRDHQLCRSRKRDLSWKPEDGNMLKDKKKRTYFGTILEHILVENLVQFFNVGPHNHLRLENADWNDGLDMAAESGESVAFSALYAQNLNSISEILGKMKEKNIFLFKELMILLDTLNKKPFDYASISRKLELLNHYFAATKSGVSGKKIPVPTDKLIRDLKEKANWMTEHIRKTEWLKSGFFNGYYNNGRQKVEGKIKGRIQMTLTGQVFPIMSEVATKAQIKTIFAQAQKYLQDAKTGGFRLNTDFKTEQFNLGRAFSFIYGDKENGAFFNHMSVMFAYALYKRGFAREGFTVLNSIYAMAKNTKMSKIYPCLPEYFNAEGRGMYSYLTGSASWYVFTLLTQIFGVRGEFGDLIIEPKLTAEQFKAGGALSIKTTFAQKPIEVKFINPHHKDFGKYAIKKVALNKKILAQGPNLAKFYFTRRDFLAKTRFRANLMEILLD